MNGNGTLTAQLRVGVSPELKRRLKVLAQQQHRTLSSAVRVLLEEAMELEEAIRPQNSPSKEYEIYLSVRQAASLIKRGYDIQVWKSVPAQLPLL